MDNLKIASCKLDLYLLILQILTPPSTHIFVQLISIDNNKRGDNLVVEYFVEALMTLEYIRWAL